MSRELPSKLPIYLLRLHAIYQRTAKPLLAEIIGVSRYLVVEDTEYDNWNGGSHGHDLKLFLPLDVLGQIEIDDIEGVADGLKGDLNKLARGFENEWVRSVHLELYEDSDAEARRAVAFSPRPTPKPDAVQFWRPGFARVFISHRDQHKAAARDLAEALAGYGASAFVAHDTIQPMSEWRSEIMKGLQTMEVRVIFLTDDFEESVWTNQEVGYALGCGVPVISLKLGRKDPPGFISHVQALRGRLESPMAAAKGLFPLIVDALGRRERLQEAIIRSFADAPSFNDAKERFERMREIVVELTPEQLEVIVEGWFSNDQLHRSAYLNNQNERMIMFLRKATGSNFEIVGRQIVEVTRRNVPF